jgi:aminoglycoside phosphotransferase (APT) family kinase protein
VPVFIAPPTAGYPWPFAGYAILRGTPLSGMPLQKFDEAASASALGDFLRALHAIDVGPLVAAGLPGDKVGRLQHARMRPKVVERLEALRRAGFASDAEELTAFLDQVAPTGPRPDNLTVVHGDLYARHVLVDELRRATGIIDWSDVHLGDPALDLAIAFSAVAPAARDAFFAAYGAVDARTLELARYRAIYHSAMVAHYGLRINDAELLSAGTKGLEQGLS